jgi:hypothetical protein
MVGMGAAQHEEEFDTFCAKAFTFVRPLPDSIMTRSFVLKLKKARRGTVKRFKASRVERECQPIQAKLSTWLNPLGLGLRGYENPTPLPIEDRASDISEILLAVGQAAGETYPQRTEAMLIALAGDKDELDKSLSVKLLDDLRIVFDGPPDELFSEAQTRLKSSDICIALAQFEGRPWAEFGRPPRPITPNGLAKLLAKYEIHVHRQRIDGRPEHCYDRNQFLDAWSRYTSSRSVSDKACSVCCHDTAEHP